MKNSYRKKRNDPLAINPIVYSVLVEHATVNVGNAQEKVFGLHRAAVDSQFP